MSNSRLFLVVGILAMGFLLWQQWQIDYAPKLPPQPQVSSEPQAAAADPAAIPSDSPSLSTDDPSIPAPVTSSPAPMASEQPSMAADTQPAGRTITVRTDLLEIDLSEIGASLVRTDLLEYPVAPGSDEVVELLSPSSIKRYTAQAGLVSASHANIDHSQRFSAERDYYEMSGDTLRVPLTWSADGIRVVREYIFERGSYAIRVVDTVSNQTDTPWDGFAYRQLLRVRPPELPGNSFSNPQRFSFRGAGLYDPEAKYERLSFDDLEEDGATQREAGQGWVSMVEHYFISAWVPEPAGNASHRFEALRLNGTGPTRYLARTVAPAFRVEPGSSGETTATLYIGPKLQDNLDEVAEGLALTVDYGIFTPFSKILFWLLSGIYSVVGNWGWAIVLLTVLVKAVFFKLTEKQYKSMANLRKLQPRIQALKERYGDDREKFQLKMMEIYKTEKVNPLGGCLPVLVQIPVFIALYWVLVESVELRQAPFMLWLNDLSAPDPYFILPLINGAAMFMTTKLSPNPAADPIQQRIMLAMPIVFSVMFAFFQAGLVLYWAVNASLSLAQQWVITKRIDAQG